MKKSAKVALLKRYLFIKTLPFHKNATFFATFFSDFKFFQRGKTAFLCKM